MTNHESQLYYVFIYEKNFKLTNIQRTEFYQQHTLFTNKN